MANAGCAGADCAFVACACADDAAHVKIMTMSKPRIRAGIGALLLLLLAPAPLLAQTTTSPTYTRREDVVYGRYMGTALTMDIFKPRGHQNGAIVMFIMSGG